MTRILTGILIVAFVATAGDYIWYEFGVQHRMTAGILHGAILLMAVGGVLGWAARRVAAGLPIGMVAGVIGALTYYAFPRRSGTPALIAAWSVVWIVLAVAEGRILQRNARSWSASLGRGLLAAAASGLTFYAVAGALWGPVPAGGRNYLMQFVQWVVAWGPGIIAIAWPGATKTRASTS